jgi:HEAT repeat protein
MRSFLNRNNFNFQKGNIIAIFSLLAFILTTTLATEDSLANSKKRNAFKSISDEALDKMKLEQNLQNLSSKEYKFFENAVYNFRKMREEAVTPLVTYLKRNDDDKVIRTAAIYALGRLGPYGERAVPTIMGFLNHEDFDTRIAAISALGRIGSRANKAVPMLKRFLYDSADENEKRMALRTLKDIGTLQAEQLLNEMKKYEMLKKQREQMGRN